MPRHEDVGDFGDDGLARVGGGPTTADTPEEVREAFLDFFQREYGAVIAFLMGYGAVHEDAEDATQDAFVDAWELAKRPGAWFRIANPRAWIRTVALRKYRRPPGARKRVPSFLVAEVGEPQPLRGIVEHGELTVQTEFVRSVLRDLDHDVRAVLAFSMDGFNSVEIARYLDLTDQHVRDLLKKGRKALRTSLIPLREQHGRLVQ